MYRYSLEYFEVAYHVQYLFFNFTKGHEYESKLAHFLWYPKIIIFILQLKHNSYDSA